MLTRLATAAIGVGALFPLVIAAGPAVAGCGQVGGASCGPDSATATSNGHTVTVSVSGSMVKGGSSGSGGTTSVPVPSPCWYDQGFSGAEYYQWVHSGEASYISHHTSGEPFTPMPGYEQHKDDADGHWYGSECDSGAYEGVFGADDDLDGFFAYTDAWFAAHPAIYVPGGQQPPTPPLPPEVLRYAAQQALGIPDPTFALNPDRATGPTTIVNIPTWFWLTDRTVAGDVTASAGGHSATIEAKLTSFSVTSAAGDSTGECGGPGTAWHAGLDDATSACAIAFLEPAAALKLTATTHWGLTWSYDGAPRGAIAPLTATWSDSVGVGEVQTVVTDAR